MMSLILSLYNANLRYCILKIYSHDSIYFVNTIVTNEAPPITIVNKSYDKGIGYSAEHRIGCAMYQLEVSSP